MIITGVPHPPENETWCAVCLALAKGEAFSGGAVQERVREGMADDKRDVFAIAVSAKEFARSMELAISWAGHPLIMRGALVVPLCATHFPAVDPTQPPPGPGPGGPGNPGLYRGGSQN